MPEIEIDFDLADSLAGEILSVMGAGHTIDGGGCTYVRLDSVEHDESSCFVGKIFEAAGLPLDSMKGVGPLEHERGTFEHLGLVLTDEAYFFLDVLQALQDGGMEWGIARTWARMLTFRRSFRTDGSLINI